MHGRWRLFRHEAGRDLGPRPGVYVALFAACLLVGMWSAATFNAVVIWPANGVMLAALLQLHRRKAIAVLLTCLTINLASNVVRGDPLPFLWLNAFLNLGQVCLAGLIARRVCGAALDLRRPRRLAAFALLAVAPAVLLSALFILTVSTFYHDYSTALYLFTLQRYCAMEMLGLLMVAPSLLLIAKNHRFKGTALAAPRETAGLMILLTVVTTGVFIQTVAPVTFLIFPVLLLVVFRLSPSWAAGAVIVIAVIGGTATVTGHGPIAMTRLSDVPDLASIPPVMRQLSVFYLFLATVVVTALPISTVMSERRRLIERLEARTVAAHAARLQAEEADAAKSRFLALMSHEMRTPLNSITGYAEVLTRHSKMDARALDYVGAIRQSGDALLMLVEDVLEVSRGDDVLRAEPTLLACLLEDASAPGRLLAQDKSLALTIEVRPAALWPVMGDRRRLRQALHHLIGNAVKFTGAGSVSIVADRVGDDTLISITDTGCGLDLQGADLFAAFVQGDDSISRAHIGAGIGLTLVRRHARLMGGDVTVESRPGQGSTFTLRLPLPLVPESELQLEAAPPLAVETGAEGLADDRGAGEEGRAPRILVVDDHAANREVCRLMLDAAGCEVFEAADGDEAIDMAEAYQFDLILMDVRMPRVDGLAATRAIRALDGAVAHTPILAVTADAMPEDAARCIAAGMNGHLAKPISHLALYAAMDRLLSAPEQATTEAA